MALFANEWFWSIFENTTDDDFSETNRNENKANMNCECVQ